MREILSPVAGRFVRSHEGYVHPPRLDRWERNAIVGMQMARPPKGPGGSISGSDDGWDDCDE